MQIVHAVRTEEEIQEIYRLLKKQASDDYAHIWAVGVNVALRISDLLALTYAHIQTDSQGPYIEVKEGKTGKARTIQLNEQCTTILEHRRRLYPNDIYLFQSHSNRAKAACKPLSRHIVARRFKDIGDIIGVHLSTHSMRKTRGYMMHKAGESIEQIGEVLNHSSTEITRRYIGLTEQTTQATYHKHQISFEL